MKKEQTLKGLENQFTPIKNIDKIVGGMNKSQLIDTIAANADISKEEKKK